MTTIPDSGGGAFLGNRRSSADRSGCRGPDNGLPQRRPTHPVIFHLDRGCPYTSQQFAASAVQFGVRLSIGRTGQCRDNALAESFFSTIRSELLGTSAWPSRAAARLSDLPEDGGLCR
ncbi:integrase core domain-containing protein [Streptomyces albidoflavus]